MRFDPSKGNTRMKFVAGVMFMLIASGAGAVTTLVGGGSTLPAPVYTGRTTFTAPLTPITPNGTSLFSIYMSNHSGIGVTYCPTGSGAGKEILAGNDPMHFQVNGVCGAVPPTVSGFGGSGLTQAHFAAADAPLSSSEFAAYVTGHGVGTQPVQLPAVAGAIAIVFKKAGVSSMTLNESQICGIFSGQIKTWNDLSSAGAVGIPAGIGGPINVVYRRDASGTSFSLLNHLSAVCSGANFKTNQNFSGTDVSGNPTGASVYIPLYASSWPIGGANGNAGVVAAISAVDGSIGYAEVATAVLGGARMASVINSHSHETIFPLSGFGATEMPVSMMYDMAIADAVDSMGRPVLTPLPTTTQCIAVVDPSTYADPATGYPIVAVSYLLANAQGNGADTTAVEGLLLSPYDSTSRPQFHGTSGYAWLSNVDLLISQARTRVLGCVN